MTSLAIARVAPSDFGGDPSAQRLEGGVDLEDASFFMRLTACACLHGVFFYLLCARPSSYVPIFIFPVCGLHLRGPYPGCVSGRFCQA